MYVHFWYFNKRWYAEVNDVPIFNRHRIVEWGQDTYVKGSDHFTERQIRALLRQEHPGYILIKDSFCLEGI